MTVRVLAFCESVTATSLSPWCLRWLDEAGPKFGGGVTTPSLCGRVRKGLGWDLAVPITENHVATSACPRCVEALALHEV